MCACVCVYVCVPLSTIHVCVGVRKKEMCVREERETILKDGLRLDVDGQQKE